jgi:hypothetical protein
LYLANSLAAAQREPAFNRFLTFQIPNEMSFFTFLKHYGPPPPGDPNEGVVYLLIVLSPEEATLM